MDCIWKTIPFELDYEVSNSGMVRRKENKRIKSLRLDKDGYPRVTLYPSGKTYHIHRLVMLTFFPDDKNESVNHIDGIKTNNCIENLEWCTFSHNQLHKSRVLYPDNINIRGAKNHMSKLTENDVKDIKYNKKYSGMNNCEISKLFGVCRQTISSILNNKSWKHV